MIVLDASALVELVLQTSAGRRVAERLADPGVGVHTPHLADVEVTQAVRRYVQKDEISLADAEQALADFRALDLQRHAHEPLLDRVWELRHNLSAYDAVYIALAEVLDTTLLTCDAPLARAPRLGCRVELVSSSDRLG
jgi:predicted nucleic acid-binding protein